MLVRKNTLNAKCLTARIAECLYSFKDMKPTFLLMVLIGWQYARFLYTADTVHRLYIPKVLHQLGFIIIKVRIVVLYCTLDPSRIYLAQIWVPKTWVILVFLQAQTVVAVPQLFNVTVAYDKSFLLVLHETAWTHFLLCWSILRYQVYLKWYRLRWFYLVERVFWVL